MKRAMSILGVGRTKATNASRYVNELARLLRDIE
jgi:hypothetical protein